MTRKKSTHHTKSKPAESNIFFRICGWALVAIQFFTSLLLIFSLKRLNILQGWQFFLVCAVLVLIFVYTFYKLVISKRAKTFSKIFACIIAIIISGLSFFAYQYIQKANDFISDITGEHEEVQYYEVRTHKDSGIKSIKDLDGKTIGFMSTNPNLESTKAKLKETISFEAKDYEEIGILLAAFYDKEVDAVIVNESYYSFLEESDSTFDEDSVMLFDFKVHAEKRDIRQPVNVTTEPFIVYISGSDSRGSISQTARSDVNIVAVINPQTAKILLVSIPRDYYVQLHGTTGVKDKLTHAGVYGIEKSKTTIEDLLGIKVNYTVKVGFQAVTKIVNAIDGVDIDSDQALKLSAGNHKICEIQKGMNHLDGDCALRYARERYSYSTGDRHRGQNQQQVLTAIVARLSDVHYASRYTSILDAAKGSFQTSLTEEEITGFARYQLSELKKWSVESIQLDGTGSMQPTYSMGSMNLYVMIPNQASIDAAKTKIAEYLTK